MTYDITEDDMLASVGCPHEMTEEARRFVIQSRNLLQGLHGDEAPLSRVEDVLAECLDDPAGVMADGAPSDLMGDLDPEARAFAAKVAASRKGGGA